jgi:hypothetical protein
MSDVREQASEVRPLSSNLRFGHSDTVSNTTQGVVLASAEAWAIYVPTNRKARGSIVRAPRHRYHAFVAEQIKKAGIILPLKHFWAKAQQKGYRLWISHTRKYIQ